MSDEEDSMSDGFSASEEEWKPSNNMKDGESSDDDDSDFEGLPLSGTTSGTSAGRKKFGEPKARSAAKQASSKKRSGLSLRTKLYNKYKPPPKTLSSPGSIVGKNSPTASTSRTYSKNYTAPNESKSIRLKLNDGQDSDASSDSSINNYLVNPEDLDIQSSFFNVEGKSAKKISISPVPVFDCNAGMGNLSDSDSNTEKDGVKIGEKAFDFNNLLEYAKNLERVKESVARHAEESNKKPSAKTNIDTLDVYAVLALGEKQQNRSQNDEEYEDDEDDEGLDSKQRSGKTQSSKLSKTKSTRTKRHTKTRPTSTVAAIDTEDSDWEEVADSFEGVNSTVASKDFSQNGSLEIHVELQSTSREKKIKSQQDIENAFKRRLNRDMKERQVLLHKVSLLCLFGRTFFYNRLLNDTILMENALKLLPSKAAYPSEKGTEIKYLQSMVTWFKSAIKLKSQNLYPEKSTPKTKSALKLKLLKQIQNKEAGSKQDMIFICIILLRGMGLQCRLLVNMQPLPLKPAQSDLLTINMKKKDKHSNKNSSLSDTNCVEKNDLLAKADVDLKSSSKEITMERSTEKAHKEEKSKMNSKSQIKKNYIEKSLDKNKSVSDNSTNNSQTVQNTRRRNQNEYITEKKTEDNQEIKNVNIKSRENINIKNESSVKTSKQTKTTTGKTYSGPNEQQTKPSTSHKNVKEPMKMEKNGKSNAKKIEIEKTKTKTKKTIIESNMISEKEEEKKVVKLQLQDVDRQNNNSPEEMNNSQKENRTEAVSKPTLSRLKRTNKRKDHTNGPEEIPTKKPTIESESVVIPKIMVNAGKEKNITEQPSSSRQLRCTRSRSKSPQVHISTAFMIQSSQYKDKFPSIIQQHSNAKNKNTRGKSISTASKVKISTDFLKDTQLVNDKKRVLRSRQKTNEAQTDDAKAVHIQIPQLDGAHDENDNKMLQPKKTQNKNPNLKKLNSQSSKENSDEDFEPSPSPSKKPKIAPAVATKKNRKVLSSDDENPKIDSLENAKRKKTASDMWLEVWCDVEEQWVCVDLFKGKVHCVDTIKKSASPSLAYVFAFQNDLSIKDVTARYCTTWATVVRKYRVDKAWLDTTISKYLGHRTKRDIKEDHELRRIHEEKPMPSAIGDYKNHPFYALERHLLKFEALYPPNAPALGYIRGEPVYSRDCVHTLHSRDIWLKQARTVKLGEKPYKIVKARPKWDRITQTVIKDQPLEIFGYWQTQDYEPPTAENGLVPRNAYGNVELFKPSMLPKKTKHIRLPGLNRICKKLGIDCANAVVGFDFHQGACHPTYDGFVVCEEFEDQVVAAWHQDQEELERKEQAKYEARVYGNWKKLIRGLLIRERLKLKYNF